MEKLSIEQMEKIEGGGCGKDIAVGVLSVFALAASTGPLAIGIGAVLLGFAIYDGIQNDNCLAQPSSGSFNNISPSDLPISKSIKSKIGG